MTAMPWFAFIWGIGMYILGFSGGYGSVAPSLERRKWVHLFGGLLGIAFVVTSWIIR